MRVKSVSLPNRTTKRARTNSSTKTRIRYAVVGLGYIAQIAVLPAFSKAKNCELAALVSDDKIKLDKLSRKYKVPSTYSYEEFDECLNSGAIDAVYIALPNSRERTFPKRDQFAPELIYFADCVINDKEPEPSGKEGLADVRIIRALDRSAATGRPVRLDGFEKEGRPTIAQEIHEPPVRKPELVRAATPSRED